MSSPVINPSNKDMEDMVNWANDNDKKRKKEKIEQQENEKNKGILSYIKLPYFELSVVLGIIIFLVNLVYTSNSGSEYTIDNILTAMNMRNFNTPIDE